MVKVDDQSRVYARTLQRKLDNLCMLQELLADAIADCNSTLSCLKVHKGMAGQPELPIAAAGARAPAASD